MASLVSRSKTRICHRRVSKASRPIESFYATANFSPALFERHHPVLATPRKNDSASGKRVNLINSTKCIAMQSNALFLQH
ncbi:hypothetical protein Plhal703r1_c19g0087941 [Plasmopara halstedii]